MKLALWAPLLLCVAACTVLGTEMPWEESAPAATAQAAPAEPPAGTSWSRTTKAAVSSTVAAILLAGMEVVRRHYSKSDTPTPATED